MKTNKACPHYPNTNSPVPAVQVAMTEEQEEEIERELIEDDEELVKVDGTKVQLSSKLMKVSQFNPKMLLHIEIWLRF